MALRIAKDASRIIVSGSSGRIGGGRAFLFLLTENPETKSAFSIWFVVTTQHDAISNSSSDRSEGTTIVRLIPLHLCRDETDFVNRQYILQ
jgi:hypothetical protein